MGKTDYEMKSRGLSRDGSLFGPSPQNQLLNAVRSRDLRAFRRLLSSDSVDPDHLYDYPDYKTCLDIACSEPGMSEFVKLLLEKDVDVNRINEQHHRTPLHFAVEIGDLETVKILLDTEDIDVNILYKGNTALHSAIKQIEDIDDDRESKMKTYEDIIELLVKAGTDVNIPDLKNVTPIYSAARQGLERVITIMIDYSESDIDLDSYKDRRQKTARTMLLNTFPHLLSRFSNGERPKDINVHKLFSHLNAHDEEKFLKDFEKMKKSTDYSKVFTENNGQHTLLQYACNYGMDKVVFALLQNGADPNVTSPGDSSKPVALACSNGYDKILKILLNNESTNIEPMHGETLLQIALRNYKSHPLEKDCDYKECIKLLLENPKECSNINFVDLKGNTALHYATRNGDQDVVLSLLRNGACIGVHNKFDEFALADISPKTFESYLDECITTNSERTNDEDYEIQFNYNFLVPPSNAIDRDSIKIPLMDDSNDKIEENDSRLVSETNALLYMTKHSELKPLLKHPVITSFLYLKWHRISYLFYMNIAFYTLFWVSLVLHILFKFSTLEEEKSDLMSMMMEITKYTTIAGLIILIFREVLQLIVSPAVYFRGVENLLEICLIVVTSIIMFSDTSNDHPRQQFYAVAILLSSTELILLIGLFPRFSTNVVMLKTVSWNFFKFLLWYCILIIAFALSFYTLFRTVKPKDDGNDESVPFDPNKQNGDDDKETDFFLDPGMSLFKTIVMLTGEFDAGSINFETFPVTSHLIFIFFVFMIPIVLFNLLNGLAVSDTQAIKANSELVGHVLRIQLISHCENIIMGDMSTYANFFTKVQNACCWLPSKMCIKQRTVGLRWIAKNVCLFPSYLPMAQIGIKVNQDSKVVIFTKDKMKRSNHDDDVAKISCCCLSQCNQLKMDRRIVKAAKAIINERSEEENDLKKIQKKLTVCEKKLEDFEKLLSQIYDAVKN